MFYYLQYLQKVHDSLSFMRLFDSVTFRTGWAAITALAISFFFGKRMIALLKKFQIGQQIREEGRRSHGSKRETPTMGGILIVTSVVISTLLWSNLAVAYVWIAVCTTLAYAGIGFADDYLEVKRGQNLGLTGRQKLVLQFAPAFLFGLALKFVTGSTTTFSVVFLLMFSIVLVGSSKAVTLTERLDGLAVSVTIVFAAALTAFTFLSAHQRLAEYFGLAPNPGTVELIIFCAALTGASLGLPLFQRPGRGLHMTYSKV
jgi:phospho-N-acetylmuramoyl-pentapeptide-transferase